MYSGYPCEYPLRRPTPTWSATRPSTSGSWRSPAQVCTEYRCLEYPFGTRAPRVSTRGIPFGTRAPHRVLGVSFSVLGYPRKLCRPSSPVARRCAADLSGYSQYSHGARRHPMGTPVLEPGTAAGLNGNSEYSHWGTPSTHVGAAAVPAGFGLYTVGFPLIAITALSCVPRVSSEYPA